MAETQILGDTPLGKYLEDGIAAGDAQIIALAGALDDIFQTGERAGVTAFGLEKVEAGIRVLDEHGAGVATVRYEAERHTYTVSYTSQHLLNIAKADPDRLGSLPGEPCPHCGEVHFPAPSASPGPPPAVDLERGQMILP